MTGEQRQMLRSRCDFCGGKSIAAEYEPLHRHSTTVNAHALPTRACLPCLLDPRPELHHEPGDWAKGLVLSSGKVMTWTLNGQGPHHCVYGGAPQPEIGMPGVVAELFYEVTESVWWRRGTPRTHLGRQPATRVALEDLVAS